jgi:hypothetical protein
MILDFEDCRSERRSFFCPNKLWKELKKQTKGCVSISKYIREAILEKMIKDDPYRKDYFKDLV